MKRLPKNLKNMTKDELVEYLEFFTSNISKMIKKYQEDQTLEQIEGARDLVSILPEGTLPSKTISITCYATVPHEINLEDIEAIFMSETNMLKEKHKIELEYVSANYEYNLTFGEI